MGFKNRRFWKGMERRMTLEESKTRAAWSAAEVGDEAALKGCVEYSPANMTMRDEKGNTILHYAAKSGSLACVKYLVERVGLSPVEGNYQGETPYDIAYEKEYEALLSYFEEVTGFKWENSFKNPIREGFFPDPSIVRVGDTFYMVNSSFVYFPCIPVSRSRDLIHWEIIGYAITEAKWAHLDALRGGMGYWAPDISYYNGRFYITATLRGNDDMEKRRIQMVTSSEKPEGPYEEPHFIDEDGIDPSIFHDSDGRHYMLLNKGARILELSEDCYHRASETTMLWYGDWKIKPEGPHLVKYGGFYYLFMAEGGTGMGHRITVARAKQLMGPYEPSPYNPVLHQWDESALLQCCGHGKPVQLEDGRWFVVYLCMRRISGKYGILGRETALEELFWTEDGWPVAGKGRKPVFQSEKPFLKNIVTEQQKPVKALCYWKQTEWLSPRPLEREKIACNEEGLILRGSKEDLCSLQGRSVLLRRQTKWDFQAECTIAVNPVKEAESFGMACYYDENSYIKFGWSKKEGRPGILLQEYVGDAYRSEQFFAWSEGQEKCPERLTLKIKVQGLVRTFEIIKNQQWIELGRIEDTSYLSSEGLSKGKRFTGAMLGMYVHGEMEGCFLDWSIS